MKQERIDANQLELTEKVVSIVLPKLLRVVVT